MAIQKLTVENFTVFDKMEIEFCKGVNVFIGENGTGKTHLLKMLYSFSVSTSDPDANREIYFMSSLTDSFGVTSDNELISKSLDNSQVASIYLKSDEGDCQFEIYPSQAVCHQNDSGIKGLSPPVFIPSKDMLTHSRGLLTMAKRHSKDMPFDKTLLDIIQNAENWKVNEVPKLAKNIVPILEGIINGKIIQQDGDFFVLKSNGDKIRFSCESEGIKKFGLLWQLLMSEIIIENGILLWDEPEANINPKLIPDLVEILLELSRNGVQIFLATHEYNMMKYFSMNKKSDDNINFYSLYKTENGVAYECEDDYDLLENNVIIDAEIKLHRDEVEKVLGK